MRELSRFAILLVITAVVACAQPAAQHSTELAARTDAWEEAFNAGDVDTLVAMYTDDARVLPPNDQPGQGSAAVRSTFNEMIEAGLKVGLETIEAIASGDIGYKVGTYTIQGPDGAQIDRGKFIDVWRRVGGEWRISNDIWNSDLPAGSGATALTITHEVKDPASWLAAFQGPGSRRELFAQHGVSSTRTFQCPDDPKRVALLLEISNMAAFQAFVSSPEAAESKMEDGVIDSTLRIMEEVE